MKVEVDTEILGNFWTRAKSGMKTRDSSEEIQRYCSWVVFSQLKQSLTQMIWVEIGSWCLGEAYFIVDKGLVARSTSRKVL